WTHSPQVTPTADDPELEAVFAVATNIATATFQQHRYISVPMETRGIIGHWDPYAQQLNIWASTQSGHELRGFYSRLLNIPENRVRVIVPDVGGGFGLKVMSLRDE